MVFVGDPDHQHPEIVGKKYRAIVCVVYKQAGWENRTMGQYQMMFFSSA